MSPDHPLDGQPTAEGRRLLWFAAGAVDPVAGFGWLDDRGRPTPGAASELWVVARMTHVFSLAALLGVDGAAQTAAHGVHTLLGVHHDTEYDGWYAAVDTTGRVTDDRKLAYPHAFVALAATSAQAAGIDDAQRLLDRSEAVLRRRFLDVDGRVVEGYDRTFATCEPYRGANASMHLVEAALALADIRGDDAWRDCALGIAEHLVHGVAREHGYLLPEHFGPTWVPDLDHNADRPGDPFRPFGCTPGHLLEWSRLLVDLDAALDGPPAWLLEDAEALFATAVRVGWAVDGEDGFVYTVDWDGQPVVRARMHWVLAEAVLAADALHRRTGSEEYAAWSDTWWRFIETHLVDRDLGSWHHELDEHNRPAATVWRGKPDVYHAFQATLLPDLPLSPVAVVHLAGLFGRL